MTRMNTDTHGWLHGDVTGAIIAAFFEVYKELGYGFLESVYRNALVIALAERGLRTAPETPIRVWFHGQRVGDFRADVIVEDIVIVELETARTMDSAHEAKLINYLRATDKEVGLLLNFGPRPTFKRFVFHNHRKGQSTRTEPLSDPCVPCDPCESVAMISAAGERGGAC